MGDGPHGKSLLLAAEHARAHETPKLVDTLLTDTRTARQAAKRASQATASTMGPGDTGVNKGHRQAKPLDTFPSLNSKMAQITQPVGPASVVGHVFPIHRVRVCARVTINSTK